jgi:hypothetical protein
MLAIKRSQAPMVMFTSKSLCDSKNRWTTCKVHNVFYNKKKVT